MLEFELKKQPIKQLFIDARTEEDVKEGICPICGQRYEEVEEEEYVRPLPSDDELHCKVRHFKCSQCRHPIKIYNDIATNEFYGFLILMNS